MEKQDYLTTWGYLEMLRAILEQRAKDAAARGEYAKKQMYLQECSEICALQEKIGEEVEGLV